MLKYFELATHVTLQCPYPGCGFSASSKPNLVTHLNEEHIKYEQFSCPTCARRFVSFPAVSDHLRQAHAPHDHRTAGRPGILLAEPQNSQLPFLTVKHPNGEADLFLEGGVVVVKERPRSSSS